MSCKHATQLSHDLSDWSLVKYFFCVDQTVSKQCLKAPQYLAFLTFWHQNSGPFKQSLVCSKLVDSAKSKFKYYNKLLNSLNAHLPMLIIDKIAKRISLYILKSKI